MAHKLRAVAPRGFNQRRALLALASIRDRHFLTPGQRQYALDVLIPRGYVDAYGTWRLTEKGQKLLVRAGRKYEIARSSRDAGPYRFVRAQNLKAGDRVMLQGARPLTLRTVLVTGRGEVRATASDGTRLDFAPEDRVRVSPGSGVLSLRDRDPRISPRKQKWISDKIRILRHEGYPQRQAIAIAFREAGIPQRRRPR